MSGADNVFDGFAVGFQTGEYCGECRDHLALVGNDGGFAPRLQGAAQSGY